MSHLTVRGLPVGIQLKTCTSMLKMILRKDRIKKMFVRELSEIHGRYAKLAVLEFTSVNDTRLALKRFNGLDFKFDGANFPLSAEIEDYTKPTPYYNNSNQSNHSYDNYNSNQNFNQNQSDQNYVQEYVQYPGVNPNLQQGISNLGFRDVNQEPAYENLYASEISQTYKPPAFNQPFQSQGMRNDSHHQDIQHDRRERNFNNGGSNRDFGNSRRNRDSGSRGGKRDFGSRGAKWGGETEFNDRGSRKFSRQGRSRSPKGRQDYQDQANKIDMEIEILRKQRIIIEEERRLLMEKKKLEILKECGPQAVLEFEQRGSINKRRRSPTPQKYRRSFTDKFSGPRGPDKFMGPPKGHRNDRPQDIGPNNPKRRRTRPGRSRDDDVPNNNPGNTRQKQPQDAKKKPGQTDTGKKPYKLPEGVIPKFVLPCKKILAEMNYLIFTADRTATQAQKLSKLITLGLRKRLFEAIKNKPYMTSVQIHELYRRHYPLSTDKSVIDNVLKAVKKRREMMAATRKAKDEETKASDDSSGQLKDEIKEEKDETETTTSEVKPEDKKATKSEAEAKEGDDTDKNEVANNEDGEKENEVKLDEVGDKKEDEVDQNDKKIDEQDLEEKSNADSNAEKADKISMKSSTDECANESNNISVDETNEDNLLTSDANDVSEDVSDAAVDKTATIVDITDSTEDKTDTTEVIADITEVIADTTEVITDTTEVIADTTEVIADTTEVITDSIVDKTDTDVNETAEDANDTTENKVETEKSKAKNETKLDTKGAPVDENDEIYDKKVNDILTDVEVLVGQDIETEVDNWIEGGNVGWDDIDEL